MIQIIDDFYFEFDRETLQYDLFQQNAESGDKEYIGSYSSIQGILKAVHAIMTDSLAKKIGASKIGDYKQIASIVSAAINTMTDCATM